MVCVPRLMIQLRLGLGGIGRLGGFDRCGLGFGAVRRSGCLLARASVSIGSMFAWLLLDGVRRDVRWRWLAG